jgi:septum formation protein
MPKVVISEAITPFILASASPRRLELLAQLGLKPDKIIASDIDETAKSHETPSHLALRLAREKALSVADSHLGTAYILAADTVVCVGRRILPKAENNDEVRACLELLSGRGHRVITSIALIDPKGHLIHRSVETRLTVKRLSKAEITDYISSNEGIGKAGGYAVQGRASGFIIALHGSYSGVVGLPLYETRCLLQGAGYRCP